MPLAPPPIRAILLPVTSKFGSQVALCITGPLKLSSPGMSGIFHLLSAPVAESNTSEVSVKVWFSKSALKLNAKARAENCSHFSSVSPFQGDVPLAPLFIPFCLGNSDVELHVLVCSIFGGHVPEIVQNLCTSGPVSAPMRVAFKGELVRMRGHIACHSWVSG